MTEAGTCGGILGWVTGAVVYMPRTLGEVVAALVAEAAGTAAEELPEPVEQPARSINMVEPRRRQNRIATIRVSRI